MPRQVPHRYVLLTTLLAALVALPSTASAWVEVQLDTEVLGSSFRGPLIEYASQICKTPIDVPFLCPPGETCFIDHLDVPATVFERAGAAEAQEIDARLPTLTAPPIVVSQAVGLHLKTATCIDGLACDADDNISATLTIRYSLTVTGGGTIQPKLCATRLGVFAGQTPVPPELIPDDIDDLLPPSKCTTLVVPPIPGRDRVGQGITLAADKLVIRFEYLTPWQNAIVDAGPTEEDTSPWPSPPGAIGTTFETIETSRVAAWSAFLGGAALPTSSTEALDMVIARSLMEGLVKDKTDKSLNAAAEPIGGGISVVVDKLSHVEWTAYDDQNTLTPGGFLTATGELAIDIDVCPLVGVSVHVDMGPLTKDASGNLSMTATTTIDVDQAALVFCMGIMEALMPDAVGIISNVDTTIAALVVTAWLENGGLSQSPGAGCTAVPNDPSVSICTSPVPQTIVAFAGINVNTGIAELVANPSHPNLATILQPAWGVWLPTFDAELDPFLYGLSGCPPKPDHDSELRTYTSGSVCAVEIDSNPYGVYKLLPSIPELTCDQGCPVGAICDTGRCRYPGDQVQAVEFPWADPAPFYADDHPLTVRVWTNTGIETLTVGPPEEPDMEETSEQAGKFVDCFTLASGLFGIPGLDDPRWIVDPPKDLWLEAEAGVAPASFETLHAELVSASPPFVPRSGLRDVETELVLSGTALVQDSDGVFYEVPAFSVVTVEWEAAYGSSGELLGLTMTAPANAVFDLDGALPPHLAGGLIEAPIMPGTALVLDVGGLEDF